MVSPSPATAALIGGCDRGSLRHCLSGALRGAIAEAQRELQASVERERKAREQAPTNFQIARQTVKVLAREVASKTGIGPYMDPVRRKLLERPSLAASVFTTGARRPVGQARLGPRDRRYGESMRARR